MDVNFPFVFQVDSDIVTDTYGLENNYLIDYFEDREKSYCVVYFSSNDIYYPNTDIAFTESIKKKNRFEWFGTRVQYAYKHIFLRDIKKQWYLEGINEKINSPIKIYEFLREATNGYKIITVGASAGGFAAILHGQLLNAEKIFSFNGQFEIKSLLNKSSHDIDPIIFRRQHDLELLKYYDTTNFINNPTSIYYFNSLYFPWDVEQSNYVKDIQINKISFKTNNHGVPFLKSNLSKVLNLTFRELNGFVGQRNQPLYFSLKLVGFVETLKGLNSIFLFVLNKIYIATIQKWKVRLFNK